MTFYSKEINIVDEGFGCTITFNEERTDFEKELKQSIEELMNSTEKYIMFQRTYAEDSFEKDYAYFESSEYDNSGDLVGFVIDLHKTRLEMSLNGDIYKVEFKEDNEKYVELLNALNTITKGFGELIIH